MSSIEKILGEIRDRANVLREHIDRGRYDGLQPRFQAKMEEFMNEGTNAIRKFYKNKHGMLYKIKSKNDEKRDIMRLYEIVKSHEHDLTNRVNLLNYYSRQNIQEVCPLVFFDSMDPESILHIHRNQEPTNNS